MTLLLYSLVRGVLSGTPLSDYLLRRLDSLNGSDWESLLETAKRQTLSGMLLKALEQVPEGVQLNADAVWKLMVKAKAIALRSAAFARAERDTLAFFSSAGVQPVVMKGSSCAKRYPFPELRESGDIDLYLAGEEFDIALEALSKAGVECAKRPDGSVNFLHQGCLVELHRQYFDLHVRPGLLPEVPSDEAELLMLSAHILKHACGSGVGLRQLFDFALAYRDFSGDRERLQEIWKRVGLERWNALLLSCIECEDETSLQANPLWRIIDEGGNFGHHISSGSIAAKSAFRNKISTAGMLLRRLPFSLRYAPREAFPRIFSLLKGNFVDSL